MTVGSSIRYRHTIRAGAGGVAMYTREGTTETLNYLFSDHQGSVESVAGETGTVLASASFTTFGTRRSASDWLSPLSQTQRDALDAITRQGYTYQTVLGSMGLNHMNGRVQDAISGTFLSPDPFVPDFGNTQDFNRYAYVRGNPMTLTDPSGFDPQLSPLGPTLPGACSPIGTADVYWGDFVTINDQSTWHTMGVVQVPIVSSGCFSSNFYIGGLVQAPNSAQAGNADSTAGGSSPDGKLETQRKFDDRSIDWEGGIKGYQEEQLRAGFTSPEYIATLGLVLSFVPGVSQLLGGSLVTAEQAVLTQSASRLAANAEAAGAARGTTQVAEQIARGSNTQMARQALSQLRSMSGTAAQKASAYESMAAQVNKLSGGSWSAARLAGADGSHIFVGEFGQALVISPSGQIFRGSIINSVQFTIAQGGTYTPIYGAMTGL